MFVPMFCPVLVHPSDLIIEGVQRRKYLGGFYIPLCPHATIYIHVQEHEFAKPQELTKTSALAYLAWKR